MNTQQEVLDAFNYDPLTGLLSYKPRALDSPFAKEWNTKNAGRSPSTLDKDGYLTLARRIKGKPTRFRVHRLIWLMHYNTLPQMIDHIDGDKLNNRIENLRECTYSENNQNQFKATKRNKSGFLGVVSDKVGYRARIRVNNVQRDLGTFRTPEEAHQRYLQEKRLIHPYGNI